LYICQWSLVWTIKLCVFLMCLRFLKKSVLKLWDRIVYTFKWINLLSLSIEFPGFHKSNSNSFGQTSQDEGTMDKAWRHGGERKCVQNYSSKTSWEETTW
jgi:hypothetical protein